MHPCDAHRTLPINNLIPTGSLLFFLRFWQLLLPFFALIPCPICRDMNPKKFQSLLFHPLGSTPRNIIAGPDQAFEKILILTTPQYIQMKKFLCLLKVLL